MLSLLTGAVTISIKAIGAFVPGDGRSSRFDRALEELTPLLLPGVLTALIMVQAFSAERRLTLDARAIGVGVAVLAVRFHAPPAVTLTSAALATAAARLIYTYALGAPA
jgi:branched chain amino acid efflux pump